MTKICDQVVALLSPEQSASIVWNDEQSIAESTDMDVGDGSDRLFTFEVAETDEQEENAIARPGFQVPSNPSRAGYFTLIVSLKGDVTIPFGFQTSSRLSGRPCDPRSSSCIWRDGAWVLDGQLCLAANSLRKLRWTHVYFGGLKAVTVGKQEASSKDVHTHALHRLNSALVLSETLDEKAVQILVGIAIAERFPEQCDKWRSRSHGARTMFTQELTGKKETIRKDVIRGEDSLRGLLREAVVDDVMKLFP
jgi:hypothetical protein